MALGPLLKSESRRLTQLNHSHQGADECLCHTWHAFAFELPEDSTFCSQMVSQKGISSLPLSFSAAVLWRTSSLDLQQLNRGREAGNLMLAGKTLNGGVDVGARASAAEPYGPCFLGLFFLCLLSGKLKTRACCLLNGYRSVDDTATH